MVCTISAQRRLHGRMQYGLLTLAGAFGLDGSLLTGRTLLNLDTEDWGEIFIGCAGKSSFDACARSARKQAASAHCSCTSFLGAVLQRVMLPSDHLHAAFCSCCLLMSLAAFCCLDSMAVLPVSFYPTVIMSKGC